jgi:hypothetical protein
MDAQDGPRRIGNQASLLATGLQPQCGRMFSDGAKNALKILSQHFWRTAD